MFNFYCKFYRHFIKSEFNLTSFINTENFFSLEFTLLLHLIATSFYIF